MSAQVTSCIASTKLEHSQVSLPIRQKIIGLAGENTNGENKENYTYNAH